MKVLLREDVDNLGYAGEVHKVADGYGRNYLIPKGFAVLATPAVLNEAEHWRKKAEVRRIQLQAEYAALAGRIEDAKLTFVARAGDSGKLYGSVTTAQITDDLNDLLGTDIDRRKVGSEPLRQLGEHYVVIRLSSDFQPKIKVVIESEDEVELVEEIEEVEAEEFEEEAADDEEDLEEEFEDEYDEYLDETG